MEELKSVEGSDKLVESKAAINLRKKVFSYIVLVRVIGLYNLNKNI